MRTSDDPRFPCLVVFTPTTPHSWGSILQQPRCQAVPDLFLQTKTHAPLSPPTLLGGPIHGTALLLTICRGFQAMQGMPEHDAISF